MNLKLEPGACPLPLAEAFVTILRAELDRAVAQGKSLDDGAVLNFRDPTYSAETGGFHPVEVAIDRSGRLLYVTDFSFVGTPPMAELAKEIDFDFSMDMLQLFGQEFPLDKGAGLFQLFQKCFAEYHTSGVYQVEVSQL